LSFKGKQSPQISLGALFVLGAIAVVLGGRLALGKGLKRCTKRKYAVDVVRFFLFERIYK
jgi:hypothetical protein